MIVSEHCTITARLRCFSSCDGAVFACRTFSCDNSRFHEYFRVTFYANGSCVENEGHVSIVFNVGYMEFKGITNPVSFSCMASVVDASGSKRFPQSLVLDFDDLYKGDQLFFTKGLGFEKFVKRGTLLNDPSELLPDDCLTLCLEIDYEVNRYHINCFRYDNDELYQEDIGWYLRMETEFGQKLCRMSSVFRDMMECTAVESGSDRIQIAPEESRIFQFISCFLNDFTLQVSLSCMCKVYLLADKYDMQPVIQLCYQLLISVLRAMNTREKLEYVDKDIHRISELAERFENDENLREILSTYSDIKNKIEGRSGELDASDSCELETEWNCEFKREEDSFDIFVFSKNKSGRLKTDILK